LIEEENMFNDPPPSGFEYILVKIHFTYVKGPSIDTTFDLSKHDFAVISEDGYEYDIPSLVTPEPDISADLYPGASHEGWAAYQVYTDDTAPILAFGREYSGEGGIWFQLYE
jgi:hypothetical protein